MVLILLYVFIAVVVVAALLNLFIGTMRMHFAGRRLFRLSRESVGELVRWALLIVVIALGFVGMAYLIIVLT